MKKIQLLFRFCEIESKRGKTHFDIRYTLFIRHFNDCVVEPKQEVDDERELKNKGKKGRARSSLFSQLPLNHLSFSFANRFPISMRKRASVVSKFILLETIKLFSFLDQPILFNGGNLPHEPFRSFNHFMIDDVFRWRCTSEED